MEGINQWIFLMAIVHWARLLVVVGVSGGLLWYAVRRLPGGWRRWGLVSFVVLFWIVDLVPGAVGFRILCRREAGLEVTAAVPGQPDIVMDDLWASAIAARILYKTGRVEYVVSDGLARRLGLRPGLHRFDSLETPASNCWLNAFSGPDALAACATATPIAAPGARYRFENRGPADGETAAGGPWDLGWWADKHQARVVDRMTGETLATYTMLSRRWIPSVTRLIRHRPTDATCPKGQTPDGLSYALFSAAFPDLGGRGQ